MKNKEEKGISLVNLLIVTGVCFLGFTLCMKLLDGVTIKLLLDIGLATLGLGILALFANGLFRRWENHKTPSGSHENQTA